MRSNKKGFTLIELLIVVVIIGILAAIAIPKFSNAKEKAIVAAMKSDLKNYAGAQEMYADGQTPATYANDVALLTDFKLSSGNIASGVTGTGTSWSLTLSHPGTAQKCTMSNNLGAPTDGTPICS